MSKSESHPACRIGLLRKLMMSLVVTALILAMVEGGLRLLGLPVGIFDGAFPPATGLWEPGLTGWMKMGPRQYRIRVNDHGFRGPDLRTGIDAADLRIVAIGDSMTDGFYVDNPATYPFLLNQILSERDYDVEVINAARGGGTMDRYVEVLEQVVLPLAPDVVVVTFVSNDLADLGKFPLERGEERAAADSLGDFFVTDTAIGEALMELSLRLRSPHYESSGFEGGMNMEGDARYQIPGGGDFEANARLFYERFGAQDGRLLAEALDRDTVERLGVYLGHLNQFVAVCRAHGIKVLFLYMPAYPEIYLEDTPTTTRDVIAGHAAALELPFMNPAQALREGSAEGPLHLAPIDFHMNPRGNRVLARAVADRLIAEGWLGEAP